MFYQICFDSIDQLFDPFNVEIFFETITLNNLLTYNEYQRNKINHYLD